MECSRGQPVNAAQLRADTNDTLSHLSRYDSTTTSSITNTTTNSRGEYSSSVVGWLDGWLVGGLVGCLFACLVACLVAWWGEWRMEEGRSNGLLPHKKTGSYYV
uniref:Uncharacterized protein n=1 Tax=Vespula pensylvanica TaxID=30213 RepID=A0A834NZ37_VESPE|nr:hypothetical protein H0235_009777 [Vespula pensylvanica]